MQLMINNRKVENPLAAIAMVLFALTFVGVVISLILLVLLPLIGIFISSIVALVVVVVMPIMLWFVLPVLFITIIGWFFGHLFK
tara:strand:- start:16 stop:267 length:252 start_codon:yes stop_codon:yes gene_type:complete